MTGWYGDDPIFRTLIWSLMLLDLGQRRSAFGFRVAQPQTLPAEEEVRLQEKRDPARVAGSPERRLGRLLIRLDPRPMPAV